MRHLVPFFVSRQVVCGAGRVGLGQDGRLPGFQLSQRADFFEVEVGLETTLKRPIINTRDEPHADADRYRRLHVIIGDANLSEISTYLKVGTTALVLAMIEDGFLPDDLTVAQPVRELHEVSHDPSLQHLIRLADGRRLTAVQLQAEYYDRARKFVDDRQGRTPTSRLVTSSSGGNRCSAVSKPTPYQLARRAGLGGKAAAAERIPRSRRPRLGCSGGYNSSTFSTPTCGPTGALSPTRRTRCDADVAASAGGTVGRRRLRQRTPARTSAANVCAATAPPSLRRRGTPSSST